MPGVVGGIRPATLKATFFTSWKGSSQGLASDMCASACERSPDCRHVFRRPIGQGAERIQTEPSPRAGPSERRFGAPTTPRLGVSGVGCKVPEGEFDFLGYTFGRMFSARTGQARIGYRPSKKSIQRAVEK